MSVSGSGTAIMGVEVHNTQIVGASIRGLNSPGSGHAKPDAIAG
jgi:hypothetical protein